MMLKPAELALRTAALASLLAGTFPADTGSVTERDGQVAQSFPRRCRSTAWSGRDPGTGRRCDTIGQGPVNGIAIGAVAVALVVAPVLGRVQLPAIVLNLLDFAAQSGRVAGRSRVPMLGGDIRGRTDTLNRRVPFVGGSLAGTIEFSVSGWAGVCGLCIAFVATAYGVRRVRAGAVAATPAATGRLAEPHS